MGENNMKTVNLSNSYLLSLRKNEKTIKKLYFFL